MHGVLLVLLNSSSSNMVALSGFLGGGVPSFCSTFCFVDEAGEGVMDAV